MQIEYRAIDELKAYENNTRTHSDEQVAQIAASIKEFGFTNPVLIDGNNQLIAGHGRVKAALVAGISEVPTIRLDHLSDDQVRALVIADNQLALNAGWDEDLLQAELCALNDSDFNMALLGFDSDALSDYLGGDELEKPGLTDEDAAPAVQAARVSTRGDVWIMGGHRLMCGDSTGTNDVSVLLCGGSVDLVFTDPPYGIDVVQSNKVAADKETTFGTVCAGNIVEAKTYEKIIGDETTETAERFYKTCIDYGLKNIVLWGGNYFSEFLKPSRCWIIWDKEMTGNFSQAEMAWTSFTKGGIKVFKFLWNGLSREGNRKDELKNRVHPTQKPVGLFVDIFNRFDGFQTIYDGFGGSGSTLIACEKTNRQCYLMELSENYCDVIVRRWQDYTGEKAVRESDGLTFDEVAADG